MPPTIGEQLKQARLERKLTIKKVSQATAVRAYFLDALEADNFESLPSPVQARGFLRIYANYLGLDAEQLLATLRGDIPAQQESTPEVELAEQDSPEPVITEANPSPQELPAEDDSEPQLVDNATSDFPYDFYDAEDLPEDLQEDAGKLLPLSQSIFIEIGQQLKGRRELLSLTLDEIERHTHIRKHHLLALEAGAIDDLPSTVQARGILSSYAQFLDLDADSLLLRFAEGLQASRQERYPNQPQKNQTNGENTPILPPALKRILSTDLVFGGGMILAMIIFAVWGATRIISQKEQVVGNANSTQSISEALLATSVVQATVLPSPSLELLSSPGSAIETSTPIEIPTTFNTAPVQVVTALLGDTWMRVTVDGKVEFQGRTVPGGAYTFDGDKKVDVLVADGSLVQIVYNQKDMGPMGDVGQITEIIYTPKGVLLPTPTATPSPTRTPRVTPTYTPSITPSPAKTSVPIG